MGNKDNSQSKRVVKAHKNLRLAQIWETLRVENNPPSKYSSNIFSKFSLLFSGILLVNIFQITHSYFECACECTISRETPIAGMLPNQQRSQIKPGIQVKIVLKQDQQSGKLTEGIVKDILTNSSIHPHGIKVRLTDGKVGRVQSITK